MNIKRIVLLLGLAAGLLTPGSALAQSEPPALVLRINRDFGYGGFDNSIEGLFSLRVEGPDDLVQVEFYIDDQLMANLEQPPFRFQFSTSDYSSGEHIFSARGHTRTGLRLESNQITRVLLTKEESRQAVVGIMAPILGIAAAVLLGIAALSLRSSAKPFDGKYGILGGAVCPRCQLPYALNWLALRLFIRRWQRCPHCGKWALVGRASPADLAAAEARWRGQGAGITPSADPGERKRRQIDDSRYDGQT